MNRSVQVAQPHRAVLRMSNSTAFAVRRGDALPTESWWICSREEFADRLRVEARRMQRSWWAHHLTTKTRDDE